MTAINAASSAVYLKGRGHHSCPPAQHSPRGKNGNVCPPATPSFCTFTLREKAQTYGLAGIFLILLYNSPSGLVLYWTLNNLFSLCKNAVQRWMKEPCRAAHGCVAAGMLLAAVYMLAFRPSQNLNKRLAAMAAAVAFALLPLWRKLYLALMGQWTKRPAASGQSAVVAQLPDDERPAAYSKRGIASCARNGGPRMGDTASRSGGFALFIAASSGLALLLGLVLPASVIATDAVEFSFIGGTDCPLYYIMRSLCVCAGMFVVWPLVIYRMFGSKVRRALPYLDSFLLVTALLNVYVFRQTYGYIDVFFKLNNRDRLSVSGAFYTVLPILAMAAVAVLLALLYSKGSTLSELECGARSPSEGNTTRASKRGAASAAEGVLLRRAAACFAVLCIAQVSFSAIKMHSIMSDYKKCAAARKKDVTLSARNNIEKSFHFSHTGQNVVVIFCDRAISSFFPYILRQFPDLNSKFSGFVYYPNTASFGGDTHQGIGPLMGGYEYTLDEKNKRTNQTNKQKYDESISVMPKLFLDAGYHVTISEPQDSEWRFNDDAYRRYKDIDIYYFGERFAAPYLIERGDTYQMLGVKQDVFVSKHIIGFSFMQSALPILRYSLYNGSWYFQTKFENENLGALRKYAYLYYLDALTDDSAEGNTFTFIGSTLIHDPTLLQEPGYIPNTHIDEKKATCGYYQPKLFPSAVGTERSDIAHYHVTAAAMLLLGKWFDCLRTLGVYDNTRIIIVSDHGMDIPTPAFGETQEGMWRAKFNAMLMVKDFGAQGDVATENTFMTNADTLFLAKQGLSVSDTNPFTGKKFADTRDKSEVQVYAAADDHSPNLKQIWVKGGYTLCNNIFDENNWKPMNSK